MPVTHKVTGMLKSLDLSVSILLQQPLLSLLLMYAYVLVLSEETISARQLYQVLGNSINVRVVSTLIHLLVTAIQ